jgi:hypothetical protein
MNFLTSRPSRPFPQFQARFRSMRNRACDNLKSKLGHVLAFQPGSPGVFQVESDGKLFDPIHTDGLRRHRDV